MARLTLLFLVACVSYAAATAITREADLLEDYSDEPELRTIYGNATVPWEEGEVARIRVLSDLVTDLEFNCKAGDANAIPEVCVRHIFLAWNHRSLIHFFSTAKHVLWHNLCVLRRSRCLQITSRMSFAQARASLIS